MELPLGRQGSSSFKRRLFSHNHDDLSLPLNLARESWENGGEVVDGPPPSDQADRVALVSSRDVPRRRPFLSSLDMSGSTLLFTDTLSQSNSTSSDLCVV